MFFNKKSSNLISAADAKAIMDSRKVTILDVRTMQEFKSGHIKKAKNLELRQIPRQIESMIKNKDEEILVYCLTGSRSRLAARALGKMGYTKVSDFGGLHTWPY